MIRSIINTWTARCRLQQGNEMVVFLIGLFFGVMWAVIKMFKTKTLQVQSETVHLQKETIELQCKMIADQQDYIAELLAVIAQQKVAA